ncbi:rhomboid family intramembrane serine protease [Actinopolyspora mortivallis]|uniref:Rhomboid family intramembrane serine protease n=1 Tax=Actinopolyspora mortivallis TaxID=33906 RepID=A0A2T0GTD1_ACTMO|nr:rhomboid family intramembrane serine protease [Actinopolyspora mortivallis]
MGCVVTVPPEQSGGPDDARAMPVCVRHPDRPTGLRCTRCERPACPECLREASVGYHCVDCLRQSQRNTRQPVTVAGARLGTKPVLVPVLIALNIAIFLVTAVQAGSPTANFHSELFQRWAMAPPPVAGGQWWRVVTSGFLHQGMIHLLVNMVALWIVGRELEVLLGRLRFLAVYLLGLLGGSLFVFLFGAAFQPVVGASAALYGLFGGIAVAAWRLRLNMRPILLVIGINVLLTVTIPGISLLGHLGGLVLGTAATAALLYAPAHRRGTWQAGALAALLLVVLAAMLTRDAVIGDVMCGMLRGETRCVRVS